MLSSANMASDTKPWREPSSTLHSSSNSLLNYIVFILALSCTFDLSLGFTGIFRPFQSSLSSGSSKQLEAAENEHQLTLRHVFHHGTGKRGSHYRQFNVNPKAKIPVITSTGIERLKPLRVKSRQNTIHRLARRDPSTIEPMLNAARQNGQAPKLPYSAWKMDDVSAPDHTDKETVIALGNIAANAYILDYGTGNWEDPNKGFNVSVDFGWESDGIRGHVFADATNSTIVMGIKGTTPAVFDGDGTTSNDKINDNLLFGCCCGAGEWLAKSACDCYSGTYSCNQTCLIKSMKQEDRYYRAVLDLYSNVTQLYPDSTIWVAGHSLGGGVSALLGLTYGLPVFTYEAPGDALAASRLGLPAPPDVFNAPKGHSKKFTGVYHFGHTADPIFMGTCNGVTASCSLAGYALETGCHSGHECVYDTVADKGWRVGIGLHGIRKVIDEVLKAYDTVPECIMDTECTDCALWKYFESNGSSTTTSASSSPTTSRARTTTCKTPGWWGCLDETTTATTKTTSDTPSTTSSSSSSTFTCKTPGWFGCKDKTTSSTTGKSTTSSSTCSTPGRLWGCRDALPSQTSPTPFHSTTCQHPGMLWGCWDKPQNAMKTQTTIITTTAAGKKSADGVFEILKETTKAKPVPAITQTTIQTTSNSFAFPAEL